jgi:hypothetical protein
LIFFTFIIIIIIVIKRHTTHRMNSSSSSAPTAMMLKYSTPIFQSATEESKTLSVVMTVFPPAPLSAATGMMSAAARQLKGTTSTAAE